MFAFFNLGVEELIILGVMGVLGIGGIIFALWLGAFSTRRTATGLKRGKGGLA